MPVALVKYPNSFQQHLVLLFSINVEFNFINTQKKHLKFRLHYITLKPQPGTECKLDGIKISKRLMYAQMLWTNNIYSVHEVTRIRSHNALYVRNQILCITNSQ